MAKLEHRAPMDLRYAAAKQKIETPVAANDHEPLQVVQYFELVPREGAEELPGIKNISESVAQDLEITSADFSDAVRQLREAIAVIAKLIGAAEKNNGQDYAALIGEIKDGLRLIQSRTHSVTEALNAFASPIIDPYRRAVFKAPYLAVVKQFADLKGAYAMLEARQTQKKESSPAAESVAAVPVEIAVSELPLAA